MKGLMVSLIIVIFAGVASSVSVAGQQAGEDAAGFRPRLRPIPAFERPGPDDSEDDVNWPAPTSLLSRNSTTTSNSFADQRFGGSPTPESAPDDGIRFDVKVDDDAISKLRQGLKVFSPVEVRDENSNAALHPSVVSDIALFHNDNTGKQGMVGVRLEPAPMEPGSTTLKFEIHEDQLNRIENDAFLFNVPEEIRGRFNRVEFVAVAGPTGSHNFSSGVTGGTRGAGFGLTDPNAAKRFQSTSDPSEFARQWDNGSPQPGPSYEPGDSRFNGPAIESVELARRSQVPGQDPNQNVGRRNGFSQGQNRERSGLERSGFERPVLNTSDRFQFADREPAVEPKASPFGRTWDQPEDNNQSVIPRRNASNDRDAVDQRDQQALVDQQFRALQQQLADERAQKELLARDASDWKQEAGRIAQQRNDYSDQLRVAQSRPAVQPSTRPVNYQERYSTAPTYRDPVLGVAGDVGRRFGDQRGDFGTRETAYGNRVLTENEIALQRENARLAADARSLVGYESRALSDAEIALQRENARLAADVKSLARENGEYASRLASVQRSGPAGSEIQPTSYNGNTDRRSEYIRTADARNLDDPQFKEPQGRGDDRGRREGFVPSAPPGRPGANGDIVQQDKDAPRKSSSADLIWLLPLLLGSLALNVFLWLHCRTLDLRYSDLADELRGTVGASTVV